MSDEIKINKTTALLLAGLVLAAAVGGFMVFGTGAANGAPPQGTQPPAQGGEAAPAAGGVQDVYLKATAGGYDKSEIVVRKGSPVRLHFTAINAGCGAQLVIYGTDVRAISKNGQEAVVEFTPQKEGTFEYNCGMKMFPPGRFVVTA